MAHVDKDTYAHLHQNKAPPGAGKGCLWRDTSTYDPENYCSHRWQARLKAEGDPTVYNYPAYASLCASPQNPRPRGSSSLMSSLVSVISLGRVNLNPAPNPGDWDLTHADNFAESASRPWAHNAHHIVPNSTLTHAINNVGETEDLIDLMKQGLLRGGYNLNDEVNMIILPMGRAVAAALGLPRHLKGHLALPWERATGDGRRHLDHPDYRNRVERKLRPTMQIFRSQAQAAQSQVAGTHDTPNFRLSKAMVEELSIEIYASIKAAGPYLFGKSLDEMRF